MSIDYSALAHPKGRTRKQVKAKRQRLELAIKRAVRRLCEIRDGHCRMNISTPKLPDRYPDPGIAHISCGPGEWAHFGEKKRAKTRGLPPAERHTTAGSLMLCRSAHRDYDQGRLLIKALTKSGCDGPLRFTRKGC